MAKKVRDLPNKGHTGVDRNNDLVHVHIVGRTIDVDGSAETDFKIPFVELFDYGEEIRRAYIYKSGTQTLTANTWTEISWDTVVSDPFSMVLGDTSGFLTPESGLYWLYGSVEANDPNQQRYNIGVFRADGSAITGGLYIWDGVWQWQKAIQTQVLAYIDAGVEVTYECYVEGNSVTTFGGLDQTAFVIYRVGGA